MFVVEDPHHGLQPYLYEKFIRIRSLLWSFPFLCRQIENAIYTRANCQLSERLVL
ncbi:uncharacterized protein BCR38DRAFT_452902 [Pseudomassariella vexata]|uniref:Uncharacterized protein n=1 Tax=Pseudomassariella vexata TaxID=1141098 RepID=A0A1Y2D758_9PEZI|nr:uncharacterized protein BCR38DRAFT_452902 [Pseudomassariella vexata]ORY55118.1 hypothetical protein BCR38DRAFT_452902 [Pseudomassariella vexata]